MSMNTAGHAAAAAAALRGVCRGSWRMTLAGMSSWICRWTRSEVSEGVDLVAVEVKPSMACGNLGVDRPRNSLGRCVVRRGPGGSVA